MVQIARLIEPSAAASQLGCSLQHVYLLIERRTLAAVRLPGTSRIRVRSEDVAELVTAAA